MTKPYIPVTSHALPPPVVERIHNALIMPMEPGQECACGVFRPDNSFCELSRTLLSRSRLSGIPSLEGSKNPEFLSGRYLFAGIGRYHFGHFLVETLIRLWALNAYADEIDGIVIIPKDDIDFGAALFRYYGPFFNLLSRNQPIELIEKPTRVDTLLLPAPGFGPLGWVAGSKRFRRYVRERVHETIKPEGPERIYISRSGLAKPEKLVDQETRIEEMMTSAGYHIFQPEKYTIEEQCAFYMAARWIVGADGSAFHLVPFAMQPGARIALIQRRNWPKVFNAFETQITTFEDVELTTIRPLAPKRLRGKMPEKSATPLEFDTIREEMQAAGFL